MRLLLALLLVSVALCAIGPLSSDKARLRDVIHTSLQLANLNKKASKDEKIKQVHLGVASLLKLDKLDLSDEQRAKLCETVSAPTTPVSPATLYDNVVSSIALKCGVNFAAVQDQVQKGLQDGQATLENTYHLVRIVSLLRNQLPSVPKDAELLSKVFDRVSGKFNEEYGGFCAPTCSVADTGYGYEILAVLHQTLVALPDFKGADKLLGTLVKVARFTDKAIKKLSASSPIGDVAVFVRGLNKLAAIVPQKKMTHSDVLQVASLLLAKKQTTSLQDIYYLGEGLSSFSSLQTPYIVSDVSKSSSKPAVFRFQVSDVYGNKVADQKTSTVSLAKVFNARSPDSPIAEAVAAKQVDDTTFEYTGSDDLNGHGVFNFVIRIKPEASKPEVTMTRTFISASTASVDSVSFVVQPKSGDSQQFSANYPKRLEGKIVIDKAVEKKLTVSVIVTSAVAPHQVFLRLFNKASNQEAVVVLKKQEDTVYRLDIAFDKIVNDLFASVSGDYDAQVIVGDATLKEPVLWSVATLALDFPAKKQSDEAELYAVRPQIEHKFQPPAKRAGTQIATIFTALVAAPLLIFLISLLRVGFNFSNYPSGINSILALVFHGLIFAMLAVIALYWVQLTIFEAMGYLAILGIIASFIGTRVLGGVAVLRKD